MKRSTERIVTTHVGSLPRPPDLLDMIQAKERGGSFDAAAFAARVKSAVAEVVRRQAEAGIDIIADGEMGRFGFIPYVNERLTGLEARPNPRSEGTWARSREHLAFPEYYAWAAQMPGAAGGAQRAQWVCTGPIVYKGHEALARDIDNLKAALAPVGYEDAFMPAVSPAQLAGWNKNEFYKTDEEFGLALADALREEYRAIVDAGLVLQIDDPQLASHYTTHPELDIAQCRNWASVTVELLNHALAGIPAERVRYHTCYGINMGPRVHDLELKHIVDIMLRVNAGAYSFEAGNPRHEHEWRVWEESKLPDGKLLIPGVITHGSNLSSIPRRSPSASGGLPKSSGARTSSPAPIAASPASRPPAKCILPSCGPSWRHWRKAPALRRRSCGAGRRKSLLEDEFRGFVSAKVGPARKVAVKLCPRLTAVGLAASSRTMAPS